MGTGLTTVRGIGAAADVAVVMAEPLDESEWLSDMFFDKGYSSQFAFVRLTGRCRRLYPRRRLGNIHLHTATVYSSLSTPVTLDTLNFE